MNRATRTAELAKATQNDPRWALIVVRDALVDRTFYYSVKTTGVYCRPSCAARLARPENVQFHGTCEEAEKAGFRPCKRCKPTEPSLAKRHAATIAKVCRMIETSEESPSLNKLAEYAGMSAFHLHRTFKAVTGLTPNGYAAAHRAHRVRAKLGNNQSVTDAIYDAGFNSNSCFYETSNAVLGMTPSNFRAGGANTDIHFAIGECSLGSILVAKSERGVCCILLGEDPALLIHDLQDQFPKANLIGDESRYEDLVAKVVGLIEKPGVGLDLPLDIRGTAFQQRVWKALQQIPVGSTASYADIAKQIGMPKAVRAVAQACGANTLAVAIPCHRVIRNDGALSGYRWGVERKRVLLDREAHA
ncbi:bifunctional DNA-binding transcriptional regulator/O6-methylguanine-DNA methyltransferase Ada [Edaphobacter aggregans]|uniref:bifunctional DNA-binding transcriptional regulator/O6-methylguanine-DNA methyltransferase Ada n=1 Tax=Edaphobacter aggregans TaxID=570835 RepID=UPI00054CF1AA|nr:bifunctional DNA-binding transcriptional regulator/O6-methylguanine-DNA methyltransferase Ada [Edaphobacter aggregans]